LTRDEKTFEILFLYSFIFVKEKLTVRDGDVFQAETMPREADPMKVPIPSPLLDAPAENGNS
jgi:hypothetical protein